MATEQVQNEEPLPQVARAGEPDFSAEEVQVFSRALRALHQSGIRYMLAGAFAKHAYTGIWRNTKDLDIFLKAEDLKTAFDALSEAGFDTSVKYEHWIGKAFYGEYLIDLIFGIGNGRMPVTEDWFEGLETCNIAGVQMPLIPLEELIAAKAYIAVRNRFDGADICHLIRGARGKVDWQRVMTRMGQHREVILWHLIMFDFVYPGHSDYLPKDLMVQLFEEVRRNWSVPQDPMYFRGTLLDPFSFAVDVEDWGYQDRRDLTPVVNQEGELV